MGVHSEMRHTFKHRIFFNAWMDAWWFHGCLMVSVQVKHFDHKTGVSQRKAAKKFGISVGYVNKLLGCNVKCRKKIKIPDRSEVQKLMAKKKCRNLTEKFAKHDWIIDDESYFNFSHSSLVGNDAHRQWPSRVWRIFLSYFDIFPLPLTFGLLTGRVSLFSFTSFDVTTKLIWF